VSQLVLSLFPGIGLLDMAFEQEGFCVVRGPDVLWGGDIRNFHPPAGKFDGVIGGPPCKGESNLSHLNGTPGYSMAAEFHRVANQTRCGWWVMEAVKKHAGDWHVTPLNNRWLGHEQSRKRYFHSNLPLHRYVETTVFEPATFRHAVLAGHGCAVGKVTKGMAKYSLPEACQLQGLPATFTDSMPFTRQWKYEVVGNGVPLPMGRAIAKAVMEATQDCYQSPPTAKMLK
jgi:DNA (cytosine-5)-methyltransferase 1